MAPRGVGRHPRLSGRGWYNESVLTEVKAGPYSVRGVSVGGVYTTLCVPELDAVLDVGLAPRSSASVSHLFLSHGHADHAGALTTLLGIRTLLRVKRRLKLFLPEPAAAPIAEALAAVSRLQRHPAEVELMPLAPGDEVTLRRDLIVRAFRTFHPVPSLGYLFLRRVDKLRPEFVGMPGAEIGRRRAAGDKMFDAVEHRELAFATDTLPRVLEEEPDLLDARVLILECTFLDGRKSVADARASCHIHIDDLVPFAPDLRNQHLVIMHVSQIYRPGEVRPLLAARLPEDLMARTIPFVPDGGRNWPG